MCKQSVTVTAAAPLLEAENAQVGQSITNQAVNDLPLVTRDWGSLAQLSAGVNTDATGTGAGGNGTADAGSSSSAYFRVNGVDEWQNDFRLNGINDNIEFYGGNYTGTNAAIVPPPDAIQEFTLQSGDFNAEFGHSTGGVINASLKSGTNGVHGDLWEYARNNDLNANYFFNRTCSGSSCVGQSHSLLSPEPLRLHGRGPGHHPAASSMARTGSSGLPTTREAATSCRSRTAI